MTLEAFQRALCDLVASPNLVRRVWDRPEAALGDYDLTKRERLRLAAVARQPGMATSCAIHRMNRVTPLYTYLRLTCRALGNALRPELDRFWSLQAAHAQFEREVTAFGAFLRVRVRRGAVPSLVEEVLDLELAVNALRYRQPSTSPRAVADRTLTLHEDVRVASLSREPLALLSALDARASLNDMPVGKHYVLVRRTDDGLDVVPVAPEFGEALLAVAAGDGDLLPRETVDVLVGAQLIVGRRDTGPCPKGMRGPGSDSAQRIPPSRVPGRL